MDRLIDLERELQPRAQEPILLGHVGRAGHQRDVRPDRDDRRLDRLIPYRRSPGADDQALEAGHVPRGPCETAALLDEGIRVDVGRESTEDDAQDHATVARHVTPAHGACLDHQS